MDLEWLRNATRDDHERVEAAVDLMTDSLSVDAYFGTLLRFFRVVSAWEVWAEANAPADLRAMVAARTRTQYLVRDIHSFHRVLPATISASDLFDEADADKTAARLSFLGRMYVMEGSTLGGQYIARFVEQHFGWGAGEHDSYFRGAGELTMPRWREFQAVLRTVPDEQAEAVAEAARGMLAVFERHMRSENVAATLVAPHRSTTEVR